MDDDERDIRRAYVALEEYKRTGGRDITEVFAEIDDDDRHDPRERP